jgi:uncharacterized protein YdeI (YjbR/CyaY-like superfamily)
MNTATFFPTSADFNTWLAAHHATEKELIVGYYKVGSGKPSMTWSESVDEALCYGWIDGVRRSIDRESYCIRFTPRKKNSIWSAVNIAKITQLTAQGRMQPAGIRIWEARKEEKSAVYAYENTPVALADDYFTTFRQHPDALKFFESQPPSYRNPAIRWVMSAKAEDTRQKRLAELIADSGNGLRVKQLRPRPGKK